MNMQKKIETYLDNIDLDIKKIGNARFFDQKVQPDVLSAVCECILECIDEKTLFTVNDIIKPPTKHINLCYNTT